MRALLILVCVFWASVSLSASFSDDWDHEFRDATDVFLPAGTDWRLLKSQCAQESLLNPLAVSPVGAKGLCQFLDGTWNDVAGELGFSKEAVWLPEVSIRAAGFYMGKLHRMWSAPRPAMDRYMIAAGSYNAGAQHLIDAQRLCGGGNLYKEIIPCLPQVTGRHANETIGYVRRIMTYWYPRFIFGGQDAG